MLVNCEHYGVSVTDVRMRVATNFRRLRKARGWSREDAAARAGVGATYISQIERMHVGFGGRAQAKWAKIFNVDVSEFLKDIGDHQDPRDPQESLVLSEDERLVVEYYRRLRDAGHGDDALKYFKFLVVDSESPRLKRHHEKASKIGS